MAKECTLSTGEMPLGGLPRNSVVRITDRPNMTSAVYCGRKASNQHQQQIRLHAASPISVCTVCHFSNVTKKPVFGVSDQEQMAKGLKGALTFSICKCPWFLEKTKVSQLF